MRRALALALVSLAAAPAASASTAERLVQADAVLRASIAHWQGRGPVPADVSRAELAEQRLELALEGSPKLAAATLPRLPAALRARVRDDLAAHAELSKLTRPRPLSALRVGPARPPLELLDVYHRAERRFGVPWNVLAAVNLVESGFGRVRSQSVSGAQGPMQFIPSTWRAYGLGGNVHDPADAILGAANYLHASGAPHNTWNALYHYNPSRFYVDAVLRYARRLRRDYLLYYARHLFAHTPGGLRRLTAVKTPVFQTTRSQLIITEPGYRLRLSRWNGGVIDLLDRRTNSTVLSERGCMWGANPENSVAYVGGCHATSFSYRWDRAASALTLSWNRDDSETTVTLSASRTYFDLRLTLTNRGQATIEKVVFPVDLVTPIAGIEAGYAPNYLPGVRLAPAFFSRIGNNVLTYPSRWAFADYLALDVAGSHVALYSVNPPPSPLAPVELGFTHNAAPNGCSGTIICLTHTFDTWIGGGATWSSPAVRMRVGETAAESMLDYRHDNGVDAYPSLAAKTGPLLPALEQAPLIKADLWKGAPFAQWGPDLRRLPSPALLHPAAYQLHGHDATDPDFLPPDPLWGTNADFAGAVAAAHSLGQLVMPYLNISWWSLAAPTVETLASVAEVASQGEGGHPIVDEYGGLRGYAVSPYVPFVQSRTKSLFEQFRTDVPVDCLFLDQLGARPWRYDFNPAAPTPLASDDGWLALLQPYANRCLMVEDGWDRLASVAAGFHGSALLMERQFSQPDELYGAGNWQPYPLADWLLHDKVLFYQHDLYDGTMTADAEVLTWNIAFGNMLSYSWDDGAGALDSPWLQLVGEFQRALGPRYAGQPLTEWQDIAPNVTESAFGAFHVLANWSGTAGYSADGYGLAPHGFLARGQGVLAGDFAGDFGGAALSPGTHYLLLTQDSSGLVVRQPIGGDTPLTVSASGRRVTAYSPTGVALGEVSAQAQGVRVTFVYAAALKNAPVAYYRVAN